MVLEDHYTGDGDRRRGGPRRGLRGGVPRRERGRARRAAHALPPQGARCTPGEVCEALLAGGASAEEVAALTVADLPDDPDARRCLELRRELGIEGDAQRSSRGRVAVDGRGAAARCDGRLVRRASRPTEASAGPCCRSGTAISTGGGGGVKAARLHEYHQALKLEAGRRAEGHRPVRRRREDRRGRAVPHRPPHPGGAVDEEVQGRPALHAGHENAGWVHEVGCRGDQRRGRRHGHRAPVHLLRTVHGRAAAVTTCTASTARSPASTATAASPSCCSPARARWSSSTRRWSRPRSPRSPTRG